MRRFIIPTNSAVRLTYDNIACRSDDAGVRLIYSPKVRPVVLIVLLVLPPCVAFGLWTAERSLNAGRFTLGAFWIPLAFGAAVSLVILFGYSIQMRLASHVKPFAEYDPSSGAVRLPAHGATLQRDEIAAARLVSSTVVNDTHRTNVQIFTVCQFVFDPAPPADKPIIVAMVYGDLRIHRAATQFCTSLDLPLRVIRLHSADALNSKELDHLR